MKTHRKVRVARMPRIKTTLFLFDMYFFYFGGSCQKSKKLPAWVSFEARFRYIFPTGNPRARPNASPFERKLNGQQRQKKPESIHSQLFRLPFPISQCAGTRLWLKSRWKNSVAYFLAVGANDYPYICVTISIWLLPRFSRLTKCLPLFSGVWNFQPLGLLTFARKHPRNGKSSAAQCG